MDFMGFHTVDIIITVLVLFLAIKGLMHGFSKELLSFITIIGGITLGANFNTTVVNIINGQHIVPTITESYSKIIGFIIIIISVWIVVSVISAIIHRFGSQNISPISRLFGYIISATRYFVIFALIIFGVSQSEFFKNEAKKLKTETKLFVPMTKIGATVLNIDLNRTINESSIIERNSTIEENNSSNLNVILNSHESVQKIKPLLNDDTNSSDKNNTKENLTSTEEENLSTENNSTN